MPAVDIIRSGELRSRATFKIQPQTPDAVGNIPVLNTDTNLSTWATRGADICCKFEVDRGLESDEGSRVISLLYAKLSMHYDPDMIPDESDAVICDGRTYGITGVFDPSGFRKKLVVNIREVK